MLVKKQSKQSLVALSNKTKVKTSAFGLKVLKKLNSSSLELVQTAGGFKLGTISVPKSLTDELSSLGLLKLVSGSGLALSSAGHSYLLRQAGNKDYTKHKNNIGCAEFEPYQAQHKINSVVQRRIDGKLRKLNINLVESPLGWLRKRKDKSGKHLISLAQFEAAERLRYDFELGTQNKQLVANYDGIPISRGMQKGSITLTYTEAQLDARKRFDKAIASVGSGLSDCLIRTCCYLEGFEIAEKKLGWPGRSLKLVILMALERLVQHYDKIERPT